MNIDTCIKMIWLLYRRAKWGFLEDVGLERSVAEPIFHKFDMQYVTGEHGRITTHRQVMTLLHLYPQLLEACVAYQGHLAKGTYRDRTMV